MRGARRPARRDERDPARLRSRRRRKAKLDLARKHSARSKELADYFSRNAGRRSGAARADAIRRRRGRSLATLETLPGEYTPLHRSGVAPHRPAGFAHHRRRSPTRRCASARSAQVREMHPDWPKVYSEVFFLDEEPRILSLIINALEEAGQTRAPRPAHRRDAALSAPPSARVLLVRQAAQRAGDAVRQGELHAALPDPRRHQLRRVLGGSRAAQGHVRQGRPRAAHRHRRRQRRAGAQARRDARPLRRDRGVPPRDRRRAPR